MAIKIFDLNSFPPTSSEDESSLSNTILNPNRERQGLHEEICPGNLNIQPLYLNVDLNQENELPSQPGTTFSFHICVIFFSHSWLKDDISCHHMQQLVAFVKKVWEEKKFLSNEQRWVIYNALLERSVDGKLKRNTSKEIAALFSLPSFTVRRIWKQAKETPPGATVNVSHAKTRNRGRKRIQIDLNRVVGIPLRQRTNLRSFGEALGISNMSLCRRMMEGIIRRQKFWVHS